MNIPTPIQFQRPPEVNPQYDVMGQRAGQMFSDLATTIAKIPQDAAAYDNLQKSLKNLTEMKKAFVQEVLTEMGREWSESERQQFVRKVQATNNEDEFVAKSSTLLANRIHQKENGLSLAPFYGQRDYVQLVAPMREKATTKAQVESMKSSGAQTQGKAGQAAVEGTGEALTPAAKTYQEGFEKEMTPGQILKQESDKNRDAIAKKKLALEQQKLDLQKKLADANLDTKKRSEITKLMALTGTFLKTAGRPDQLNAQDFNTKAKLAAAATIALSEGDVDTEGAYQTAMNVLKGEVNTPIEIAVSEGLARLFPEEIQEQHEEGYLKKMLKSLLGMKSEPVAPAPSGVARTPGTTTAPQKPKQDRLGLFD